MEQNWYREHNSSKLRCNFRQDFDLETAQTEHQDEGSYPQQPFEEISQLKMWNKNYKNMALALRCSNAEYVAQYG